MTELWQAVLLGAVQGVTEFAPISSTAHLVLIPWLFRWQSPLLNSLTFDVALHMGTLAAILGYFFRDWVQLVRAGLASVVERSIVGDPWRKLAWLLVVATVPGALAGAAFESQAEKLFRAPWLIGTMLVVLGLFLALSERLGAKRRSMWEVTPLYALIIGVGQALAIVPGVSRSGGTITAGLVVGLQREAAARFSFMLAAPIMVGAGVKKLGDLFAFDLSGSDGFALLGGFLASAVVGYLCIKYLLRYLQTRSLYVFVWYRLLVGIVVMLTFLVREG